MLYDYFFFSAPQLKRDPLGSSGTHEMHRPLPQFDNAHYGSGTARIREIVVAGHSVRWFPNRGPADQSEQSLVALHLEVFSSFYPARDLATRAVIWKSGSLETFDQLAPAIAPSEGWGDPLAATPWGRLLSDLHRDVESEIERDSATLELVKPPIWPLARQPRLTTEALYEAPPPPELRGEARSAMMAHVQYNYWRVLDWALLWPERLDRSPFYVLFQLQDRKSTRLNSSHGYISYAVFCLKKKKHN